MKSFRDTLYVDFVQEAVYIYTHVDLVEISCDGAYRIDQEKQAFVVPIGSRCTFKGIGGKTVCRLVEQLHRPLSPQGAVAGAGVFLYRMGKLQCRSRISRSINLSQRSADTFCRDAAGYSFQQT